MLDKLEDVERRFEELNARLSDPKISSDIKELTRLNKERSKVEPVVRLYREYRTLTENIAEAKELLSSDDAELKELAKAELKDLQPRLEGLQEQLEQELLPRDPLDDKNVVLEIRAGAGGDEASLFAGELFEAYRKYATDQRWKVDVMSQNTGSARECCA